MGVWWWQVGVDLREGLSKEVGKRVKLRPDEQKKKSQPHRKLDKSLLGIG